MLQAMGWQEGKGLGRHQQGVTTPISVRRQTVIFTFFLKLTIHLLTSSEQMDTACQHVLFH